MKVFRKSFQFPLKTDKTSVSFRSIGRLFQSFAALKIKVCLPQLVLGVFYYLAIRFPGLWFLDLKS